MTSIKDRIQSAFRGLLGVQPPVTSDRPAEIQATFDLAQTTVHNRRHWANADSLAARASMSPAVRSIVRKRSRHEFDNNSWYSGILRTAANHIIGCGPRLQVLTTNHEANKGKKRTNFVVDSLERGSEEALNAIFANQGSDKTAEQSLKEQKQQTKALKKIAAQPTFTLNVAGVP
jgi:hypothetical protein